MAISFIVIVIICIYGTYGFYQVSNDKIKIPLLFKYIFYSCIIFGLIECILFIIDIFKCLQIALLFSFIIYGLIMIHIFILWLFRLYNTFSKSTYAKSNKFYIFTILLFLTLILLSISAVILVGINFEFSATILSILSAFGYLIMSLWFMNVFARYTMYYY